MWINERSGHTYVLLAVNSKEDLFFSLWKPLKPGTAFREVKKDVEVLASETWNTDGSLSLISSWRFKETLHLCKGRLLLRKAEEKSLVKDK